MTLIDFEGLNCYQNALVTVAAALGIDYKRAFINLWPETDFEYDSGHKVYTTKRMPQNLEALGIVTEIFSFQSAADAQQALAMLDAGEPFLVCMDTFHIPWSPGFKAVHDMHYFAARKETPGRLSCYDPTYSACCAADDDITSYFTKMYRISRVAAQPLFDDTCREEILRGHPRLRQRVLDELAGCVGDRRRNALSLAKYVDALISNRYLYKHYLDNDPLSPVKYRRFFNKGFLSRWIAVKNGLYKAVVVRRNESIIGEVSELFGRLIDEETAAS